MITNRELLQNQNITLLVKGSGKNIQEATSDIFKKIRTEVYKEVGLPIIQMETLGVVFNEVKESEKRSIVIWKKDIEVEIDAKVEVLVKYLEI